MYQKFSEIIKQKGISPYKLAKDLGIAQSTLSEWKSGKYTPKIEKIIKIADYLGVDWKVLINKEGNNGGKNYCKKNG